MLTRPIILLSVLMWMFTFEAHSNTILLDSTIGFNGVFKLNTWVPLTVSIENRGRLVNGTLEIVIRSGNEYDDNLEEIVYIQSVELPTNSRKKYNFTLFIKTAVNPIIINLIENERTVLSKSLALRSRFIEKPMVLILGEKGNSYFFRRVFKEQPLFIRPHQLPETWYGYDGVTSVVLQAEVLQNLKHSQISALVQWVESGGFIVISGGANYSFFSNKKIKELISIQIVGVKQVKQLQALELFSGDNFISDDPFLILKVKIPDSHTLAYEEDIPLITQKMIGEGSILFLAFDFQSTFFQDWKGNLRFWKTLNDLRPQEDASIIDIDEESIFSSVFAAIPQRFPNYFVVIILLIIYAVFTTYSILRLQRDEAIQGAAQRDTTVWNAGIRTDASESKATPDHAQRTKKIALHAGVIILFCLIGVGLFYQQKPIDQVNYSSFTLLSKKTEGKTVVATQWIGIYSSHQNRFQMDNKNINRPINLLQAKYVKDVEHERFILHQDYQKQQLNLPIRRWSHQFLKTQASLDFPLKGKFLNDEENLAILIENQTSQDIKNCVIYYLNRMIPIGDIPAQKKITIGLTQDIINANRILRDETQIGIINSIALKLAPHEPSKYAEYFQKEFLDDVLLAIRLNYQVKPDRILLIGWVEADLFANQSNYSIENDAHVAMLEWEIFSKNPLAPPSEGLPLQP